jgi:hypothetical protein
MINVLGSLLIFPVQLFNIKRGEKALIHAHRIKQIGHRHQQMVVLAPTVDPFQLIACG